MHYFSLILSLILYANIALTIPLNSDNGNAYTGVGGQSPGGSVNSGGAFIDILSSKYYYMRSSLHWARH